MEGEAGARQQSWASSPGQGRARAGPSWRQIGACLALFAPRFSSAQAGTRGWLHPQTGWAVDWGRGQASQPSTLATPGPQTAPNQRTPIHCGYPSMVGFQSTHKHTALHCPQGCTPNQRGSLPTWWATSHSRGPWKYAAQPPVHTHQTQPPTHNHHHQHWGAEKGHQGGEFDASDPPGSSGVFEIGGVTHHAHPQASPTHSPTPTNTHNPPHTQRRGIHHTPTPQNPMPTHIHYGHPYIPSIPSTSTVHCHRQVRQNVPYRGSSYRLQGTAAARYCAQQQPMDTALSVQPSAAKIAQLVCRPPQRYRPEIRARMVELWDAVHPPLLLPLSWQLHSTAAGWDTGFFVQYSTG